MQLVDCIETRRFVGREFLLWLWFESEVCEGTLQTKEHGSFGLWIEKSIVLSSGKTEVTRIRGSQPAAAREAKESLRRGKTPEAAGFHVVQGERECSFTLKAEQLGIAGLKLPTVLGKEDEDATPPQLIEARRPPRRRKRESVEQQGARESDEAHEAFYERMQMTRDFEALVEALYRDFLAIRLGAAWAGVEEVIATWAAGEDVDAEAYRALRNGRGESSAATRRIGKKARTGGRGAAPR
jgi:hypothetical protein